MEKAAERILQWKAHIVRAINQEKSKIDIPDNLTEEQVLVVMDWVMKWLPQSYRETQKEWFGKKGISWHVSACITKVAKDETEFQVFTILRVQIQILILLTCFFCAGADIYPHFRKVQSRLVCSLFSAGMPCTSTFANRPKSQRYFFEKR